MSGITHPGAGSTDRDLKEAGFTLGSGHPFDATRVTRRK